MKKHLKNTEKLLEQCEKDLNRLRDIFIEIKKLEDNQDKLVEYYETNYMVDVENPKLKNEKYRVLDQDSIWNVLDDLRYEKIQLIKILAKSI